MNSEPSSTSLCGVVIEATPPLLETLTRAGSKKRRKESMFKRQKKTEKGVNVQK
jgi:hypothetical protein